MDFVPNQSVTAFHRLQVGELDVTVISDGYAGFDPSIYGANAPDGAVAEVLTAHHLPTNVAASGANIMLLRIDDMITLIDTGWGALQMPDDTPMQTGQLAATLAMLGITPEQVDRVIVTHFHPDHIGGLTTDGVPAFPDAEVLFPKIELDFLNKGPTGTPLDQFIELANTILQPIKDAGQLSVYDHEDILMPGVQAVAAPGHSPGHFALLINRDGHRLFHMSDIAHHFLISLKYPTFQMSFDSMPDVAVETRQTLLKLALDQSLQVFGYHFPFPGLGYVMEDGDGFRFLPTI